MRVFAVAEHRLGELNPISFELLNLANKVKDAGTSEAVVIGGESGALASRLTSHADIVWSITGDHLENYNPEAYADVLLQLFEKEPPDLVLLGNTSQGCELAPLTAAKLHAPIITDITSASIKKNEITVSRCIYQGKLMADLKINRTPCILTVRQGIFKEETKLNGKIIKLKLNPQKPPKRRHIKLIEPEKSEVDITKATTIVAIGRGAITTLQLATKLANLIGAAIAGTRPIIDSGILPKDRQVGISGKTVKPKIYIALGISGAFQHTIGMKDSELIIAINKDPQAPIFNTAHYGAITNLQEILPTIINKLEKQQHQTPT